jgi:hypothetical protein
VLFSLFVIAAIVLQAWAWQRLVTRMLSGALSRGQGALRYTGWAFVPVIVFVALFMAMVGLEEWLGLALVPERSPLLVIPVFALSVLWTLAFWGRCLFLRRE